VSRWLTLAILLALGAEVGAEAAIPALAVTTTGEGQQTWSLSLQVLLLMTALSLLPAALIMMTSFTRIVVVLAILRQALGTTTTPSNQILLGLALFLTLFVMMPVFDRVHDEALRPYMDGQIGFEDALAKAEVPVRGFMLTQTRESDLTLFADIADTGPLESAERVPFRVLMPAFVTSELKTAFQIGFLMFLPFLVIDLVVASVLMSMGMMMLSPLVISFPFKLLLFVLVDGWALVVGTLAASFYAP
jgi:flagellar biosynthetic protein FliP